MNYYTFKARALGLLGAAALIVWVLWDTLNLYFHLNF